MNIAMEQTEEYVHGQLKAKYGDCFIRGNNGMWDGSCGWGIMGVVYVYVLISTSGRGERRHAGGRGQSPLASARPARWWRWIIFFKRSTHPQAFLCKGVDFLKMLSSATTGPGAYGRAPPPPPYVARPRPATQWCSCR